MKKRTEDGTEQDVSAVSSGISATYWCQYFFH